MPFLSHLVLSAVHVAFYSLKKKSLGCSLLIITSLSEAASSTLAHPSYFVVRWPGSASKIPHAFIFILGSRTPPGGGSPLSESFCHSPIHPQHPVCWYLCPLRYVLPGELRNDLPVRNQGTHFLQRCVFLWVTQLSSPRRVVTRTSCTLGIGGILEGTQPG